MNNWVPIIIVFSKALVGMIISQGEALQKALLDQDCQEIIDSEVNPHFQDHNYFEGLLICIEALKRKL